MIIYKYILRRDFWKITHEQLIRDKNENWKKKHIEKEKEHEK